MEWLSTARKETSKLAVLFFSVSRINRKAKWLRVGAGEQLDSAVLARITSRVVSSSSRRGHATSCFSGGRITVSSFEVCFPLFTTEVPSSCSLLCSFEVSSILLLFSARGLFALSLHLFLDTEASPVRKIRSQNVTYTSFRTNRPNIARVRVLLRPLFFPPFLSCSSAPVSRLRLVG